MPPFIALFIWAILLAALLYFDPARNLKTSVALWVPVIWMFILASRLPSQWLSAQVGVVAQALEEGNPLDRSTWSLLILMTIVILISRSFTLADFMAHNLTLTFFLFFALVSVCWSDYPLITLRHWLRDMGDCLVVLVVLSDQRPTEAVNVVLRRLCYLLIPLSIVLIKYYPALGIHYDAWTGIATYSGATTGKNMLGSACLISGLFFFWDVVTRWPERRKSRTKRIILVDAAFLTMTLWLLHLSRSATSTVCLLLGWMVISAAHSKAFRRCPNALKKMVPISLVICVVLAFAFNIDTNLATVVGRDPTLTDRTTIWQAVLSLHTNPIVGTGYESFWLGPRLQRLWQIPGVEGINEAHNGYLEIYLNLGLVGFFSLIALLIASYRRICSKLTPFSNLASLSLALWTTILFYSVTESAFRSGLMWLTFLFGAIAVPARTSSRKRVVDASTKITNTLTVATPPAGRARVRVEEA